MIGVSHGLQIYICTEPTDMRRGFDGLSSMTENVMKRDPLSGHLFVFRNRNRDKLKILYWDRDGLAIWYKRLEQGTFQFPTDGKSTDDKPVSTEITTCQLSLLLGGIDLKSVHQRKRFQRPTQPR